MSVIKCPECGQEVSTKADVCPHCGVAIKGNLKRCPKCNTIMLKEEEECPQCHAHFVAEKAETTAPTPADRPQEPQKTQEPVHDEELDRLSAREQEVMRLIARGYTYKEVASELFISIKTVETHMSSVLRKLQLSNRSELTRWAADRRIV